MVVIPRSSASFGPRRWTALPCQRISPWSGSHRPEIVFTRLDFLAPLSPTRAVTRPAGMSRSTSVSACTAPKDFVTPRNCTSGSRTPSSSTLSSAIVTPPRVRSAPPPTGEGRTTASSTPRTLCDRPKTGVRTPLLWSDSRSLAISGERPGAQLRCRHELILDDGRVHVLRRDPCGSQEDRWNRCAAHRVGGLSIGQTRRRRLSGSQVQGERRGGLCFQIDGLVGGPALVSRQHVVQPRQRGVLSRRGERLGRHVERLQVRDDRGTGLIV